MSRCVYFAAGGVLSARGVMNFRPGSLSFPVEKLKRIRWKPRTERLSCRAILQEDATYAVAIGACICSTLLLPVGELKQEGAVLGPDDVRYAAMGIISFIPLFDWLAWVFAWLDTSKRRYLIYSIVYLAPYLKSGLSLSTDDSWLPLASVLACIVHVQLEIAVNNEGLEQAQMKESITRMLYEKTRVKELRERSSGLLSRLQTLAEQTADFRKPIDDVEGDRDDQDDSEFQSWDKRFLDIIRKNDKVEEKSRKAKDSEK